jgi:uncharacterized membrane protein
MRRSESGQVTVLVLGFTLIALSVAGLAVDGTRAFLMRRTLQNSADSSALAGAGELDVQTYYSSGGRRVRLDPEAARSVALTYFQQRGLPATVGVEATDDRVSVILRTEVDTLFLRLIGIDSLPVAARSEASPIAGQPP